MLEASHDLLEQGRTEAARHLLTEAVATMGDDEKAAALRVKLERLERLESAHLRRRASDRPNAGVPATPRPAWRSRGRSVGALLVGAAAIAVVLVALGTRPSVSDWLGLRSSTEQLAVRPSRRSGRPPSSLRYWRSVGANSSRSFVTSPNSSTRLAGTISSGTARG
jgi:hypothetical protein